MKYYQNVIFVIGLIVFFANFANSKELFYSYKIQKDDTLSELSFLFSVKQSDLIRINGAQIRNRILVGKHLKIPLKKKKKIYYKVRSGDNLYKIANQFSILPRFLKILNPQINFNKLLVDQTLLILIPQSQKVKANDFSQPTKGKNIVRKQSVFLKQEHSSMIYIVQPGDNFYSIARKYKVSPQLLIKNHYEKYQRKTLFPNDKISLTKNQPKSSPIKDSQNHWLKEKKIRSQSEGNSNLCIQENYKEKTLSHISDLIDGNIKRYIQGHIQGLAYQSSRTQIIKLPMTGCLQKHLIIPFLGDVLVFKRGQYQLYLISEGFFDLDLELGEEFVQNSKLGFLKHDMEALVMIKKDEKWIKPIRK